MTSFDFSHEDLERAARYHRARYVAFGAGGGLAAAVYAVLAWAPVGRGLWGFVDGLGWAGSAAAWAAGVVVVADLVQLPLAYWLGHTRERAWGFSRQTTSGWLADRAKGLAVSILVTAAAWTATVGLARAFPGWWPVAAGLALAAGVLVAGASRRTTKVNAYVSGFAGTRRVVLFDTLLAAAGAPEVKLIVAHELGHQRERHVLKATFLAMLSAVVAVLILWLVLGTRVASPRELPQALLLFTVLELVGLAPAAAISRRWERRADRCSLELTGDLEAFERAHIELARKNLSDLAPPRVVYLLLFSHPTPPERLALGRAWAVRS